MREQKFLGHRGQENVKAGKEDAGPKQGDEGQEERKREPGKHDFRIRHSVLYAYY